MEIARGEVVAAVFAREHGKPRPGVVIQSDLFNSSHSSLVVCPITTELIEAPIFRVPLSPSSANGLRKPCQVMIDKIGTVPKTRIGKRIGKLDSADMARVDTALAIWLELPRP
jgi:mRNA interferase MazF